MAEVTGSVFHRCGCIDPVSGKRWDRNCLRAGESGHGSWYFSCSVRSSLGRARRVRRGGYRSRDAALAARQEVLASQADAAGDVLTVGRWLSDWLSMRVGLRPSTVLCHRGYIEQFLIPHIGHLRLGELTGRDITVMFAQIGERTNRTGHPHTPSTLHHIRTTLRAALNAAVREGLLVVNPVQQVQLPPRTRPRPVFWTPNRIDAWHQTGARPRIAVWTPPLLREFLAGVESDRLYALWWLLALRGLRRGEAAALRWSDLDLEQAELQVARSRTSVGYHVFEGPPKSAAGNRIVALDKHTVRVLRAHQQLQHADCQKAGVVWSPDGFVFIAAAGAPLHPDAITRRFVRLVAMLGLPPVRLHDLRHGAACLAHAAGADLKTVQEQLGHSSIAVTADVYTNVLPRSQRRAARATARLLLAPAHKRKKGGRGTRAGTLT